MIATSLNPSAEWADAERLAVIRELAYQGRNSIYDPGAMSHLLQRLEALAGMHKSFLEENRQQLLTGNLG